MDKKLKIKICIYINFFLITTVILSFFILNDYKSITFVLDGQMTLLLYNS